MEPATKDDATMTTKNEETRRGFLTASNALEVPAGSGSPVDQMRAAYLRRLEELVLEFKPKFDSGELHGYDDADLAADERARALGEGHQPPFWALEEEIEALVGSDVEAYFILAVSRSERLVDGGIPFENAKYAAASAVALDVLRIARERGWYELTPGEEPTPEQLAA